MNNGGLSPQLDVFDFECAESILCSSEEFEMQGDRVWLVLLCECGGEMLLYYRQESGCYNTTVRY
jgi:hypothetical protein